MHLVAVAIDSKGILFEVCLIKSSLQRLFSRNTSSYTLYLCKNQDTLHLNVNAPNEGVGLSGRAKKDGIEPWCHMSPPNRSGLSLMSEMLKYFIVEAHNIVSPQE